MTEEFFEVFQQELSNSRPGNPELHVLGLRRNHKQLTPWDRTLLQQVQYLTASQKTPCRTW
jgi:hypothetical protein